MLYKDFKKMQDNLRDILVNYAYFLKKGAQIDFKYTNTFKDEILKDFKLRNENTMLVTALSKLNEKKSLEEVDKYIEDYKKSYAKNLEVLNQRIINAGIVVERQLDETAAKELENHFVEMIRKYSPLLIINPDPYYLKAYELLQMLYQQDNYQTYFAAYDLNKEIFVEKNFEGVDFDKYVSYYMTLMQNITLDTKERKNNYPFNKEEVFTDEISIARESGDFKARLNKILEANKAIKEDFKAAYGEDISL